MRKSVEFYIEKEREILLEAMAYHETVIDRIYKRLKEIDKRISDESRVSDDLPVQGSASVESYYR
jgi:hypothetical protein